jgi:vacuolar-type H+-ATPase subunit I/STV1
MYYRPNQPAFVGPLPTVHVRTIPPMPAMSATLADEMQKVQVLSGCPSLQPVTHLLTQSAHHASQATSLAMLALQQFDEKSQGIKRSDDSKRKIKDVKKIMRDVILWRFFGLSAGLLDAQKLDDCLLHDLANNELESQLKNSYLKVQVHILEELICSDNVLLQLTRTVKHLPQDDETRDQVVAQLEWALREIQSQRVE